MTAIAGIVVMLLAKLFNINTDVATILTVIGGIGALVGVIKQIYTHATLKQAALTAGAIK